MAVERSKHFLRHIREQGGPLHITHLRRHFLYIVYADQTKDRACLFRLFQRFLHIAPVHEVKHHERCSVRLIRRNPFMEYTEKRSSRMAVKPPRLPPELGYFLSLDNIPERRSLFRTGNP